MSLTWIMLGVLGLALSGVPALVMGPRAGAAVGACLNVLGSLLAGVGMVLFAWGTEAQGAVWAWDWSLPVGRLAVGIDALGVLFLVPVFLVSALGSIYGTAYWPQRRHGGNGRRMRVSWGMLAAAMALVVLARDSVLFLMAWEVMALSAFVLVATEDHKPQVRQAAWVYLVATHIGTLCLFGLFGLLRAGTGSYALWTAGGAGTVLPLTALLILALLGFGMKAGLFPLHVWLPGAHANAPSHVSAILSGVMLKMGVYGLFRVTMLAAYPPIWWGAVILAMGVVSALLGIAYAVAQGDYKRLLAYSSIENMGIVAMGLGLALLGRAAGRSDWVLLGAGAALLHVLNHSVFKPLLFLGAGNLLHAVRTRRMDRLGGLAKRMPVTYVFFVVGAVAICGLPPLNGFASEFLLYIGLLRTTQTPVGSGWGWAALAVPALAAVGALAVTGFVKLLGAVFQGSARVERGDGGHGAHDPGAAMVGPMVVLAALCVGLGLFPMVIVPALEAAIGAWQGADLAHAGARLGDYAPLGMQMWTGMVLLGGMVTVMLLVMPGRKRTAPGVTWDCGYARPTARMQYTGASFAQMVVDLAAWALWPKGVRLRLRRLFPQDREFAREVPDGMLDRVLHPAFGALRSAILFGRGIQQGSVQAYMVYVLVILLVLALVG